MSILYPTRGIVGWLTDCRVRGLRFKSPGSILTSRTETSSLITSGQGWLGPMLCTIKRGEKVSCGGVFDLAIEQPQLFRKLPKNQHKQKKTVKRKIINIMIDIMLNQDNKFHPQYHQQQCTVVMVVYYWFVIESPTNVISEHSDILIEPQDWTWDFEVSSQPQNARHFLYSAAVIKTAVSHSLVVTSCN